MKYTPEIIEHVGSELEKGKNFVEIHREHYPNFPFNSFRFTMNRRGNLISGARGIKGQRKYNYRFGFACEEEKIVTMKKLCRDRNSDIATVMRNFIDEFIFDHEE